MKQDVTTSPVNAPPAPGWLLWRLCAATADRLRARLIEIRLGTSCPPKPSHRAADHGGDA